MAGRAHPKLALESVLANIVCDRVVRLELTREQNARSETGTARSRSRS
jgi:hypothetical protein